MAIRNLRGVDSEDGANLRYLDGKLLRGEFF